MPDVPVAVDSVSPVGEKKMADITDDVMEFHVENFLKSEESLLVESQANVSSANSVVRHSAARKFNQEDPIEAACAEMILKTA